MNPENPYMDLPPEAYAALIDGIRLSAQRQRQAARRAAGRSLWMWLGSFLKARALISPPSPSTATHAAAARCSRSAVPCP